MSEGSSAAPWGDEITPLTEVCGGQYVLLHELARGDLSVVYRAKPARARDSIAFKVIQSEFVDDEVQVRRFRREAELLRKIEHPNVVRLIDHGTIEDGRDFVALELLVGSTLAEARAESERMSSERTCRIARQIARALRTMHKAGVIHRDLEPDNILLIGPENAERVKLVDFSAAGDVGAPARRVKGGRNRPPSGVVTDGPSYRAPEQLRKAPPHPSMDVFALGVIMYEMLVGEHPFHEPTMEQSARPKPTTIRSKVFDAPEELLGLVSDCIKQEASGRPGSMDEVIERIDKALLWMGVVPHEIAANTDEDARTQLWAAAEPVEGAEVREAPSSSGPVWSRDADEGAEPVSARRRRPPRAAAEASDEEPVSARQRRDHHEPDESSWNEPSSSRSQPLGNRDATPDPEAEHDRAPTGPQAQAPEDGPTTSSVPRIDLDELEEKSTLDEAPLVVDTVAWTKPQPAAGKARGKAKARGEAKARGKAKDGARARARAKADAPRRSAKKDDEPARSREPRERRARAARPRASAAGPAVAPVPRWVLPLGLLIIAILAYGVWMVWTA